MFLRRRIGVSAIASPVFRESSAVCWLPRLEPMTKSASSGFWPLLAAALLLMVGCGRIGPGGAVRPGYDGVYDPSESSSSSSTPREEYKSVYDDKGCVIGVGESGSKQQAACRSGR